MQEQMQAEQERYRPGVQKQKVLNKFFELSTIREPQLRRAFHTSFTMDSSKVTQAIAAQVSHEHDMLNKSRHQYEPSGSSPPGSHQHRIPTQYPFSQGGPEGHTAVPSTQGGDSVAQSESQEKL